VYFPFAVEFMVKCCASSLPTIVESVAPEPVSVSLSNLNMMSAGFVNTPPQLSRSCYPNEGHQLHGASDTDEESCSGSDNESSESLYSVDIGLEDMEFDPTWIFDVCGQDASDFLQ